MLRVGLRKHHQLRIGRVATELGVTAHQVVDFVVRQSEPEVRVGSHQRLPSVARQRYRNDRYRLMSGEQRGRLFNPFENRLGHPIEQQVAQGRDVVVFDLCGECQAVADTAFDTVHCIDIAGSDDVGRLAGPRRNGPGARYDIELAGELAVARRLVRGE